MARLLSYLKGHAALIIFTITNNITDQVYVGNTRNDLESQWDKMVAAAEQNMNFPLYQEIRHYGCDSFQVEEWDCTDDRSELAQLENEALKTLNAKSLKGYKTSTVIIESKKKIRRRKCSTPLKDGELDTSHQPIEPFFVGAIVHSADDASTDNNQIQQDQPLGRRVIDSLDNASIHLNTTDQYNDETMQFSTLQPEGSTAIISDTVTAKISSLPKDSLAPEEGCAFNDKADHSESSVIAEETEKKVILSAKEQKIHDAIQRHRIAWAQRTSAIINAEQQQLAILLADLEEKAAALHNTALATAA